MAIFSSTCILATHVLFLSSLISEFIIHPLYPLLLLGLGYTGYAASIWPCVAYSISDEKNLGLAFGITTCLQNFGLAVMPIVIAGIYNSYGYFAMILLFVFTALGGVLV